MMDYDELVQRLRAPATVYDELGCALLLSDCTVAIETLRKERDDALALAEEELTAAFMAGYASARKELK